MIYSEQNDETLVTLTLLGDTSAYESLVIRWQKAVLASAVCITRNKYLAEDAAQDAFVCAWMKLNTLREPAKFGAWVCRISKNCAKNIAVRFRDYISFDTLENIEYDRFANTEESYLLSEENTFLHESVDNLPKKISQIIRMHYFDGLSIAEIAERMKIPVGTVKWQLHEGRRKLRKDMMSMNETENDTLTQKVMK